MKQPLPLPVPEPKLKSLTSLLKSLTEPQLLKSLTSLLTSEFTSQSLNPYIPNFNANPKLLISLFSSHTLFHKPTVLLSLFKWAKTHLCHSVAHSPLTLLSLLPSLIAHHKFVDAKSLLTTFIAGDKQNVLHRHILHPDRSVRISKALFDLSIDAYVASGKPHHAAQLFNKMKKLHFKPNLLTCNTLLNALVRYPSKHSLTVAKAVYRDADKLGTAYEGGQWNGSTYVGFCGEQEIWVGHSSHLERVKRLVVGQKVKVKISVKMPRFGWSGHSHASIGTISAIDADGKLRIYTPVGSKTWMLDPTEVELVEEEELLIGGWVRVKASVPKPFYQWGDVNHSSIGVVHRIEDGELWVAFFFMERLWLCKAWEMERVRPFKVGDKVKIGDGLVTPRWGWGMETHTSKGYVVGVDANGKLRIKFQWREGRPWIGDPADIVLDDS